MKKIAVCTDCKREREIYAHGICKSCYTKSQVAKNPKYKENQKKKSREWCLKNKVYWKKYYVERKEKLQKYGRDYYQKRKNAVTLE